MVTDRRLGPFGRSGRRQCFTVNITDDTRSEPTELFMVNVHFCPGPIPFLVGIFPQNATTTIMDDDDSELT